MLNATFKNITLPEYLRSLPVLSGVRVTRSVVVCVCFVDRFCSVSFGHCVVCPSSIYGLLITLWYLQNLLIVSLSYLLFIAIQFIVS